MEAILAEAQQLRLLRPLDVQFAIMLTTSADPGLMLAIAWLSSDAGVGHICLPLELLTQERLFDGKNPSLAQKAWRLAGSPSQVDWHERLLKSPAVSDGSRPTPLVLDNQRLYLQRMWRYECTVAHFFNQVRISIDIKEDKIADVLTNYFPSNFDVINWQKIAAAVVITCPIALISGGPGTGKTFMVAKILAALLQLDDRKSLRILMAAPTGKSAARLTESIGLVLQYPELNKFKKQQLPFKAITLHRLLGIKQNSRSLRYHRNNLLHADILIIDEASMIDLPMMANLIDALSPQTKVIFLGDHCQLSSVEPGAVFGDICQLIEIGYSPIKCSQISRLTGFNLSIQKRKNNFYNVADNLCLLRKSYRFKENSGINRLAKAINAGDEKSALSLLKTGMTEDLNYTLLCKGQDYQSLLNDCITGYQDYLQRVHSQDTLTNILTAFNRFRVLCALREGQFGVSGLNNDIEQALSQVGLITLNKTTRYVYVGRPVIIMRNSSSLGLYNGDIGILLQEYKKKLCVYFSLPDGNIKKVPLSRLPEHETAFAMTVHKSQGTEFQHTVLVLPKQVMPMLTRELLYTAVTRASKKLSLYAIDKVIQYAIATKTYRRSGLINRLTFNTIPEEY